MFKKFSYIAIFALLTALVMTGFQNNDVVPELQAQQSRPDSFADLAEKAIPSVVNIYTTQILKFNRQRGRQQPNDLMREFFGDELFRRFYPPETQRTSLGTGFIWDKEGYIITNNHVVANSKEIRVVLSDEREFSAKIVGRDPKTDLALIKIDTREDLPAVKLGDSDKIKIGEWVVAIGNPFGIGQTVTAGIVSAKGRTLNAGPYDDFIQTDAAINQGNSGGPLYNTTGEVIGINSVIASNTGGSVGIGFAIPVNLAKQVIPQLKDKGKVSRGWLGVLIQQVTEDLAAYFDIDEAVGALVSEVVKDGPAAKAGIKQRDIILEFNGKKIKKMRELPGIVAATPVGEKVSVKILRDGKVKVLKVKIGLLPDDSTEVAKTGTEKDKPGSKEKVAELLGMQVQELTDEIAQTLGLEETDGVVVSSVAPQGPADNAGVRRGDVIVEINREEVKDPDDFYSVAETLKSGDKALLVIKRGGSSFFIILKIS